jgi:RNA-directed DNA polymerase
MAFGSALHQTPGQPGRIATGEGEARAGTGRDEARPACQGQEGSGRGGLLEQALSRENLAAAWKRVKANKGSAGVDGLSIEQTTEYLKTHWPRIRSELLDGTYRPQAVRRVEIPKPTGGTRELGVPCVIDRLIGQALLQVLQPLIDPTCWRRPTTGSSSFSVTGVSSDAGRGCASGRAWPSRTSDV